MNPIYDLIVIGLVVVMVLVNLWSVREFQNAVSPWTKLKEKIHDLSLGGHSPALSSFHGQARLSRD
jgi:hypothetical protein